MVHFPHIFSANRQIVCSRVNITGYSFTVRKLNPVTILALNTLNSEIYSSMLRWWVWPKWLMDILKKIIHRKNNIVEAKGEPIDPKKRDIKAIIMVDSGYLWLNF